MRRASFLGVLLFAACLCRDAQAQAGTPSAPASASLRYSVVAWDEKASTEITLVPDKDAPPSAGLIAGLASVQSDHLYVVVRDVTTGACTRVKVEKGTDLSALPADPATFELAYLAKITVRTEKGAPISGARVDVSGGDLARPPKVTDDRGEATFGRLPLNTPLQVSVEASGYEPASETWTMPSGAPSATAGAAPELPLTLRPATAAPAKGGVSPVEVMALVLAMVSCLAAAFLWFRGTRRGARGPVGEDPGLADTRDKLSSLKGDLAQVADRLGKLEAATPRPEEPSLSSALLEWERTEGSLPHMAKDYLSLSQRISAQTAETLRAMQEYLTAAAPAHPEGTAGLTSELAVIRANLGGIASSLEHLVAAPLAAAKPVEAPLTPPPAEFTPPPPARSIETLDEAMRVAHDYLGETGDSGVVRGLLRDLEELRRMESDLDANRGTAEVSEFARRHLQGWVLSIFQPLAHVDPANPPDHHEDPREPLSDRLRSFITTKRLELRDRLEREIGLQEIPVRADTEQYSPSDPLRRHTVVEWRIDNRGAIPGTIHRVVRPGYWLTGPTVLRPEVLRPAEVSVYASPA